MLHIAHIILTWIIDHWPALTALVGGSASLSIFAEFVIHKLHIDSKKLAYTLIHVLSFGAAVSAYYLDNASAMPTYASLVIIAQTFHRFIVSPYYTKYVLPYLNYLSQASPQPTTPYQPPQVDQTPVAPVDTPTGFVS